MQPQAMRGPVNCAAAFLIVLLRAGLMFSLMSIGRELRKALGGTGSGSEFGKMLELILRVEVSESPLHFTCARTQRQCANTIWFSICVLV